MRANELQGRLSQSRQVGWTPEYVEMAIHPGASLSHYLAKQPGLKKPIWAAFEWEVPGHEHCSVGILTGQFPRNHKLGNANALAQFEFLFDMEDNDTFGGEAQGWTGKIPNPPKVVAPGAGSIGHAKAVAAAKWLEDNH